MAARKGKEKKNSEPLVEVEDLESLEKPIPRASVHAVVTGLSPTKRGTNANYFEGRVSDGNGKARMVGFWSSQQKSLDGFLRKRQAVHMQDFEVKKARRGANMEIILKQGTKISKSRKTFDIPEADFEEFNAKDINLVELEELNEYQKVNVEVRILSVSEVQHVGAAGRKKQDVTIADNSGTARVTLWESDINSLTEKECYRLCNFLVREYNASKYLVMCRNEATVERISDIEASTSFEDVSEQNTTILHGAKIIAVLSLDSHKACLRCRARVEPASPPLGRCSQCSMGQLSDECVEVISAKLLFMTSNQGQRKMESLLAPGNVLEKIVGRQGIAMSGTEPITERELLCLQQFTEVIFFSDSKVIHHVSCSGIETTV